MRRSVWIGLGVLALVVLGGALGAKPLVRRLVVLEAERRGFEVRVAEVLLHPGAVELVGVGARPRTNTFVEAKLERLVLRVGFSRPRLRSIEVLGGKVTLRGTVDEVKAAWEKLRPARSNTPVDSSGETSRFLTVRDVDVTWDGALEPGVLEEVRGFQLDSGPGGMRLGANLLTLRSGPWHLEVAGLDAELSGEGLARVVKSARAAEARSSYLSEGSNEPVVSVEPREEQGLLRRLALNPQRPVEVARAFALLRQGLVRMPQSAVVERLWVSAKKGEQSISVGPGRFVAERTESNFRLSFVPGKEARGTPLAFGLQVPHQESQAEVTVAGGPISFQALGIREGDFGLQGVSGTEVAGQAKALLSPNMLEVEGSVRLENLQMVSARVAPEPLYFPKLGGQGKGRLALDGSTAAFEELELYIGSTRLLGSFAWERGDEHAHLGLGVKAPLVSCQNLLDSAPQGLLGNVAAIKLGGTFSLGVDVEVDTRRLADMKVAFDLKNGCKATSTPVELEPDQFRAPFRRVVLGPGNLPMNIESGPGSVAWTPYGEISPYLETALLVTEDGRFFSHDGFDLRAIESSIRDNTKALAYVRGASTISMQLAKNLYLSRDKNLARKLKEAVLTLLLEQSFDKRELLELYMNVVEFGPGIYGVRAAAEHYFGTTPQNLTIAQCFFLASILPSPGRESFESDGSLKGSKTRYIHKLLEIARSRERLSATELTSALAERLILGQSNTRVFTPGPGSAPGAPSGGFEGAQIPAIPQIPSVPEVPEIEGPPSGGGGRPKAETLGASDVNSWPTFPTVE